MRNEAPVHPGNRSVVIACHSDKADGRRGSGSGPIEPLLRYLRNQKTPWIFLIEQPHPNVPGPLDCTMEVYRDGTLIATRVFSRWSFIYDIPQKKRISRTYFRLKLRDVLALWHFTQVIKRDYPQACPLSCAICVECANAIAALPLRFLGAMESIVYYLFDWSPRRYPMPLINATYLWLDRLACRHSNFTWNITPAIADARRDDLHFSPRDLHSQITVLYGAEFRDRLVRPLQDLTRFRVIFAGGIHRDNGAHLIPETARHLQDADPRIELLVAGDGPHMPEVRASLDRLRIRNTRLLGHISDPAEIDRLQCDCLIGLAPYPDTPNTTKRWGDVIKIRSYFACGLVVVTTRVPPVHREIEAEGLGIVADESARSLADAILRLCQDEVLLSQCRAAVIKKARDHSWKSQFDGAFAQMAEPRRRTRP